MEHYTVKSGDNLSSIFKNLKLSSTDLDVLVKSSKETKALKELKPGQSVYVTRQDDDQGKVSKMVVVRSPGKQLLINRLGDDTFEAETHIKKPKITTRFAAGKIKDSLFAAGVEAGLDDKLVMELADLFGWDIDFALDIHPGDSFSVMYEEQSIDGIKIGSGPIIAATFTNQGHEYKAVRYTDRTGHTGYFAPDGFQLRKAFIRTPVNFTRISSYFSLGRHHPILHRLRAHKGVDYAAPRGTPVKAAGDGRINFVGRKGGYGKTITIQHGGPYETLYAHLNGYSKIARTGARVSQGDIIGYVGSTGLATGPHLHYEFHVSGQYRDPLQVKLPQSLPIDRADKAKFLKQAKVVMAELEKHEKMALAKN